MRKGLRVCGYIIHMLTGRRLRQPLEGDAPIRCASYAIASISYHTLGITLPVIIDAEAVALQACVRDSVQLLGVMAALGCRASRAGEFRV